MKIMKWMILTLLFFVSIVYAESESHILVGMRNQRYAMAGAQYKRFGVVLEQSLFNQDIDLQYGRIVAFANYVLPLYSDIQFALYAGTQYGRQYYDFGSRVMLDVDAIPHILRLSGTYQPFWDKELGTRHGFRYQFAIIAMDEIQLYAGLKNIPDYRETERRYVGGVVFDVGYLSVTPEISIPVNGSFEWTRISVGFVYSPPFF